MNPERWRQIDELFDEVSELPEDQRSEFLSKKCAADEDLKKEVLSLLEAQDKAEKFMENSAMNVMGKALADEQPTIIDHFLIGKTLGRYKVEGMLGAGGMGEVYLAFDSVLNRKFALKILPAEYVADADRLQRFRREAQTVSALNHPNIVTIYDVGSFEDLHFIATEFIEGKTVRTLIDEGLSLNDTLAIIAQTAEALAAAHQNNVVHRDIKPENIMVRPDGYVKILDFGLAKLVENKLLLTNENDVLKTQKGMVMGTLAYMSPEQATGDAVDHRTDIWSLGIVLYEMLTGVKPFKANDKKAAYNAILSLEPQPVSSIDDSLPPLLDSILGKFLEKDREMRYQTASDFRADLKRLKREVDSSLSLSSQSISGKSVKTSIPQKRRYVISIVAVLAMVLIIGSASFSYFRYFRAVSAPVDWKLARNVPLSFQAGTEFFPSLAPDGKTYVFAAENAGQFDIFSERVGGKIPRNLTADSAADDSQPAFSPDGERIVFRSERSPAGIYVMGASGESPRRIADFGYTPKWSPDGKEIAVSTSAQTVPATRSPSAIWIINVESGEKRQLIDKFALQPDWSPNGKQIAFWLTENGGRRNVATIPAAGGEPTVITDAGNTNWNPVWSPDGKYLYFASDRGGNMAFWRVSIDEETGKSTGEPESVSTPAKFNRHLSFSRDGKRMIYVQTVDQANVKTVDFDEKNEKVSNPAAVTSGNREVYASTASPDGKYIVARQLSFTQEDLIVLNRDGTNPHDLTNDKFFDRYARWSPDGKQIAFISDRSGKYQLWLIDADGTNLRQLTFVKDRSASIPAWSPDSKRISFDTDFETFILDLSKPWSEENLQKLPNPDGNSYFRTCDWSKDGKKIIGYFEGGTNRGMAVYRFETNSYEKINELRLLTYWLPDNRRIIYTNNGKIYITDTETKKEREVIGAPKENVRSVNISYDGKIIYYVDFNSESDIWMLDLTESK